VVSALILVMCVIRYSVNRAVLYHISTYIAVSTLMSVMCVRRHSIIRAIL